MALLINGPRPPVGNIFQNIYLLCRHNILIVTAHKIAVKRTHSNPRNCIYLQIIQKQQHMSCMLNTQNKHHYTAHKKKYSHFNKYVLVAVGEL